MKTIEEMYAYVITKDGERIYQSVPVCSQGVAIEAGRLDAIERNNKGESVEYDIIAII